MLKVISNAKNPYEKLSQAENGVIFNLKYEGCYDMTLNLERYTIIVQSEVRVFGVPAFEN